MMPILKRFFWESNFRKIPLFRFRSIGLDVHAGNGAAAGVVEVLEGRIPFQGERIYLICFWIDHNENTNELEYHGF